MSSSFGVEVRGGCSLDDVLYSRKLQTAQVRQVIPKKIRPTVNVYIVHMSRMQNVALVMIDANFFVAEMSMHGTLKMLFGVNLELHLSVLLIAYTRSFCRVNAIVGRCQSHL